MLYVIFVSNKTTMPDTFRLIEDVDTTYLRFDPNDPHFVKKMKEEIPAFAEYSVEYIDTDSARRRRRSRRPCD